LLWDKYLATGLVCIVAILELILQVQVSVVQYLKVRFSWPRILVALLAWLLMWLLNFRLLEKVTPRSFSVSTTASALLEPRSPISSSDSAKWLFPDLLNSPSPCACPHWRACATCSTTRRERRGRCCYGS